eukprot:2128289-Rhodomonas_salina.1
MHVDLTLVMSGGFVAWCGAAEGSSDFAQLVTPSILVGTDPAALAEVSGWTAMADALPLTTGAATLPAGVVTVVLELANATEAEGLEVFVEDVVLIHVNPGADPGVVELKTSVEGGFLKFLPHVELDPDTAAARLVVPAALAAACPAGDASVGLFGCAHTHAVRAGVATNESNAYIVGSAPPPASGAADWMEAVLGERTAPAASRVLGAELEEHLRGQGVAAGGGHKVAVMLNPGHRSASCPSTTPTLILRALCPVL